MQKEFYALYVLVCGCVQDVNRQVRSITLTCVADFSRECLGEADGGVVWLLVMRFPGPATIRSLTPSCLDCRDEFCGLESTELMSFWASAGDSVDFWGRDEAVLP